MSRVPPPRAGLGPVGKRPASLLRGGPVKSGIERLQRLQSVRRGGHLPVRDGTAEGPNDHSFELAEIGRHRFHPRQHLPLRDIAGRRGGAVWPTAQGAAGGPAPSRRDGPSRSARHRRAAPVTPMPVPLRFRASETDGYRVGSHETSLAGGNARDGSR